MRIANLHLIHPVLLQSICVYNDCTEKVIPGNMEMPQTAVAKYVLL